MKRSLLSTLATLLGSLGLSAAPLFQLVGNAPFTLAGTTSPAGTTSVLVAGEAAVFDAGTGAWSRVLTLLGGHHQVPVEFRAPNGQAVGLEFRDLVVETKTLTVGGKLAGNTHWTTNDGIIRVTNSVLVANGLNLTADPGVVVLLAAGASLHATNASIVLNGTEEQPVHLLPADGSTVWGELAADGAAAALELHHAEVAGGAVKIRDGAEGLLEDSYVHHYKTGTVPIAGCTRAKSVTVRRCHFNVYHETLWQFTPMLIEDSLFENANNVNSDALDFDGAPAGSVIRRCTFRHGPQSNTDAIDLGSGTQGVLVEDCLMQDFPNDKGVSIGEDSFGIVIRNCLIYGCDSGVAVKDNCTATISGCTFVNNDFGIRAYNKANPAAATGGGHITNSFDNILWHNRTTVSLLNGSTLVADHSNYGDTIWPGSSNLAVDPRFVNEAGHDYRLLADSASVSTGRNGASMGARFPVGAPMAPSHPGFTAVTSTPDGLQLQFWVDSAGPTAVLANDLLTAGEWLSVTNALPGPVPRQVVVTLPVTSAQRFYRLSSALGSP